MKPAKNVLRECLLCGLGLAGLQSGEVTPPKYTVNILDTDVGSGVAEGLNNHHQIVGAQDRGTDAARIAAYWNDSRLNRVVWDSINRRFLIVDSIGQVRSASGGILSRNVDYRGIEVRLWDVSVQSSRPDGRDPMMTVGSRAWIGQHQSISWNRAINGDKLLPSLRAVAEVGGGSANQHYLAVAVGMEGLVLQSNNFGADWIEAAMPSDTTVAMQVTNLPGQDDDLVYTARNPGNAGHNISIEYKDPQAANQVLQIEVDKLALLVRLATDSQGAIVTTAKQIADAVSRSEMARALVLVELAGGNSGQGIVQSMSPMTLMESGVVKAGDWYGVALIDTNNAVVVGQNGCIIHWNGVAWSWMDKVNNDLMAIAAHPRHPGKFWTIGSNRTFLEFDGQTWRSLQDKLADAGIPQKATLWSLAIDPDDPATPSIEGGNFLIIGSDNGMVIKYELGSQAISVHHLATGGLENPRPPVTGVAIGNNPADQIMAVCGRYAFFNDGSNWTLAWTVNSNKSAINAPIDPTTGSIAQDIADNGHIVLNYINDTGLTQAAQTNASNRNESASPIPTVDSDGATPVEGSVYGLNEEHVKAGWTTVYTPNHMGYKYMRYWATEIRPICDESSSWVPNEIKDIGPIGAKEGIAYAISNRKQGLKAKHVGCDEVVGWSKDETGNMKAFINKPTHFNAYDGVWIPQIIYQDQAVVLPDDPLPIFYPVLGFEWRCYTASTGFYTCWAVGTNGTCFFNVAAPQTTNVTTDLYGVDFTNITNGIIVGQGGTILFTTNQGNNWTPGVVLDEKGAVVTVTADIYGVEFLEGTYDYFGRGYAWACGAGGLILYSTDGGATWTKQESGVTNDLYDIAFPGDGLGFTDGRGLHIAQPPDRLRGVVCGDGVILHTTSGGEATVGEKGQMVPGWTQILTEDLRQRTWYSVDYFNDQHIYAGGEEGMIHIHRDLVRPGKFAAEWEIQHQPVYDIAMMCSPYYYDDTPAPGCPTETIAPYRGAWAQYVHGAVGEDLIPDGVAVGPDERAWRLDCFTGLWNVARNANPYTADYRGVRGFRMDVLFGRELNEPAPNEPLLTEEGKDWTHDCGLFFSFIFMGGCATDGRTFNGSASTDPNGIFRRSEGSDHGRAPRHPTIPRQHGWLVHCGATPLDEAYRAPFLGGSLSGKMWPIPRAVPDMFPDRESAAYDINDIGFVVGEAIQRIPDPQDPDNRVSVHRAFLVKRQKSSYFFDTPMDLGSLGGGQSCANAIDNRLNRVVGWSNATAQPQDSESNGYVRRRGFLWQNGVMYDLNALLYGAGYADQAGRFLVYEAKDINEFGEICGLGYIDDNGNGFQDENEPLKPCTLDPVASESRNDPPRIMIVHPGDGEAFRASPNISTPNIIPLSALAHDSNGRINSVQFYVTDLQTNAIYRAGGSSSGLGGAGTVGVDWEAPVDMGQRQRFSIVARVVDDQGEVTESQPITISLVSANTGDYVIDDLGTLGGSSSIGRDINNRNEVVGAAQIAGNSWAPFVWSADNGMIGLPMKTANNVEFEFGNYDNEILGPVAINDFGVIVGCGMREDVNLGKKVIRALMWRPVATKGNYLPPEELTGSGLMWQRSIETRATAISSFGEVCGWAKIPMYDGNAPVSQLRTVEQLVIAFTWRGRNEGMAPIGSLGGPECQPTGINAARSVTGSSLNRAPIMHGFMWNSGYPYGSMIDIGNINQSLSGGSICKANAINYQGHVCGGSQVRVIPGAQARIVYHPFVWIRGQPMVDLLAVDAVNQLDMVANDLNDGFLPTDAQMMVVGNLSPVGSDLRTGCLAFAGQWYIIQTLLPQGSDWTTIQDARGVNNTRVVTGTGRLAGNDRAYVFEPVNRAGLGVNTPPAIAIINPANDAVLSVNDEIVLSAIAGDGDGIVNKVDFWIMGDENKENLLIATVNTASDPGSGSLYYYYRWNQLRAGEYQLVGIATDNLGATRISEPIRIRVFEQVVTKGPSIAIANPINGIMITPLDGEPKDGFASAIRVQLDGQVGNPAARIVEGSDVTLSIEDKVAFRGKVDSKGILSIEVQTEISEGVARLEFFDADDPVYKDIGEIKNVLVPNQVKENAGGLMSPQTFTMERVEVGPHDLRVVAWDKIGNQTSSRMVHIYVHAWTGLRFGENIPPVVKIISPSNGAAFTVGTGITYPYRVMARDPDGTVQSVVFMQQVGDEPDSAVDTNFLVNGTGQPVPLTGVGNLFSADAQSAITGNQAFNIKIYALATDDKGATSRTETITVTMVPSTAVGVTQAVISNIPTFGGDDSQGYGLNSLGVVTGEAQTESGSGRPFVWRMGEAIVRLPIEQAGFDLGNRAAGRSINDHGDVVGEYVSNSGAVCGFYYNSFEKKFWKIGRAGSAFQEIRPRSINEFGVVTGTARINGYERGFVWDKTWSEEQDPITIGTLGGIESWGAGINMGGAIAGTARFRDRNPCSVRYDVIYPSLSISPIAYGQGNGIAYNGTIIGTLCRDRNGDGVLDYDDNPNLLSWVGSGNFILYPAAISGFARGTNNAGDVVYVGPDDFNQVAAWYIDAPVNVNGTPTFNAPILVQDMVPDGAGWEWIGEVQGINDSGQIVGTGTIGGNSRAYLVRKINVQDLAPVVFLTKPVSGKTGVAQLITQFAGDHNDLVFSSARIGPSGNNIRIAMKKPAQEAQQLSVMVVHNAVEGTIDVEITLSTDGGNEITATASAVRAALESNSEASKLIIVEYAMENNGSGIVLPMEITALQGGSDEVVLEAIATDVDNSGGTIPFGIVKVEFWANGVLIGSDSVPENGDQGNVYQFSWNMGSKIREVPPHTDTRLNRDYYEFVAVAVDKTGKVGKSDVAVLWLGEQSGDRPTVTILPPPADGESYDVGTSINLIVQSHDDVKVTKLQLWIDNGQGTGGEPISVENPGDNESFAFTVTEGTHTIVATAVDGQGMIGKSKTITIYGNPYIKNKAPRIEIAYPTNGATLRTNDDFVVWLQAFDPDGRTIEIKANLTSTSNGIKNAEVIAVQGTGASYIIMGQDAGGAVAPLKVTDVFGLIFEPTEVEISVTAIDDLGEKTTSGIRVMIISNLGGDNAADDAIVTILNDLGGGQTQANDINESNIVVGRSLNANGQWRPFSWCKEGGLTDLLVVDGCDYGEATAINKHGRIVGFCGKYAERGLAPTGQKAVIAEVECTTGAVTSQLSLLAVTPGTKWGKGSQAFAINDFGQIVGRSTIFGEATSRGFVIHQPGRDAMMLGTLGLPGTIGYSMSQALDVSNGLQAVGSAFDSSAAKKGSGFIYNEGEGGQVMMRFDNASMRYIEMRAINIHGQAVGNALDLNGKSLPIKVENNGIVVLPGINGNDSAGAALGITDDGMITGWSTDEVGNSVAVIWKASQIINLNSLIGQGSGWTLNEARAMNGSGSVVALATRQGRKHSVVVRIPVGTGSDILTNSMPGCMFAQPLDDTTIELGTVVPLKVYATDTSPNSSSGPGMESVTFYAWRIDFDDMPNIVGVIKTVDTDGAYSMRWTPSERGVWYLSALANDKEGGTCLSQTGVPTNKIIKVTVQGGNTVTKPTLALALVPGLVKGAIPTDDGSGAVRSNIELVATPSTGVVMTTVKYFIDGQKIGASIASPHRLEWTGSYIYEAGINDPGLSGIDAGTYSLIAEGTTSSGAIVRSDTIVFAINGRPTVNISSPIANSEVDLVRNSDMVIRANANDLEGRVTRVEFLIGNPTSVGSDLLVVPDLTKASGFLYLGSDADGSDGWTFKWQDLRLGKFLIRAVATDSYGARGISDPVPVVIKRGGKISIISDPGPVDPNNLPVTVIAGNDWSYRVRWTSSGLSSKDTIRYEVKSIRSDGADDGIPAGLVMNEDVITWKAIEMPKSGSYYRLRVSVYADDGDAATPDAMDQQYILIQVRSVAVE